MVELAQINHQRLVAALRQLAPSTRKSVDRAWSREPALRVIDCVLSLNRNYDRFVVPRLDRFEREHRNVHAISHLRAEIKEYPSPHQFVVSTLHYRHEARAAMLAAVVEWFVTVSGDGPPAIQLANLEDWAKKAEPGGYKTLRIRGFAISGFQYLRMLFGADTTKPDIHIRRFVQEHIGRSVSELQGLRLLERAAAEVGVSLRDVDTSIWESAARPVVLSLEGRPGCALRVTSAP